MTRLDDITAEAWPTGTFGHALPPRPANRPKPTYTPEEQARHRAELLAALRGKPAPQQPAA